MNFLPIFKYRLKDDMKAVGVFLIVTLLCMVLVVYGIMIMVSEINDRVVSNFSMAPDGVFFCDRDSHRA